VRRRALALALHPRQHSRGKLFDRLPVATDSPSGQVVRRMELGTMSALFGEGRLHYKALHIPEGIPLNHTTLTADPKPVPRWSPVLR
jgi:hypothetical protein